MYDWFRVEWESAAWMNPGRPDEESRGKRKLLLWRLHLLLAELTGDLAHHFQSHIARPDLAISTAALGYALGRAKRSADAMHFLRDAYQSHPLDRSLARAYNHCLGHLGYSQEQEALKRERRNLTKAAPELVRGEEWFTSDSEGPSSTSPSEQLRIVWQGPQTANHALALINREICSRLNARGHELSLVFPSPNEANQLGMALPAPLQERWNQKLKKTADVHVSNQWPPVFEKPSQDRSVVLLAWEFGSLPRSWIEPLATGIGDVWVPHAAMREGFLKSGIPGDKVHVIPMGVARASLHSLPSFPLQTKKRFRFLYVGSALEHGGADLVLKTLHEVFTKEDDVCLVMNELADGRFDKGKNLQKQIERYQSRSGARSGVRGKPFEPRTTHWPL